MNIFTLTGRILVDNKEANDNIDNTSKKSDTLAGKFSNGLNNAAKAATVAIAAIGTATVTVGKGLLNMAEKSAETADRIDKLSAKIGISKQSFQEWDYIMGQNGMDVEKLQVGVKTLTSQMDAASNGNKSAISTFEQLKLSWEDGNGKLKSQEQMLNEAIMALANMENGTEKARLATELFGKAGIEMMPMLNNGAQGITELKNRAHELGLVMSDDAVSAGVKFGDTMDDLKKSFGAIGTQLGSSVIPIFQELADTLIDNMPTIKENVSGFFTVVTKVFKFLVDNGGAVISVLTGILTVWMAFNFIIFLNNLTTSINGLVNTVSTISAALSPSTAAFIKWGAIIIGVSLAVAALVVAINYLIGRGSEMNKMVSDISTMASNGPKQSDKFTNKYVNGSHRQGLERVPYDGYIAETHKDEAILTKKEADDWRNGNSVSMNETNNLLRSLIGEFAQLKQAYKDMPREQQRLLREGVAY